MSDDPLEKVYEEASQWLRLSNHVSWITGSLFVPASFAAVSLGITTEKHKFVIAVLSIMLMLLWMMIFRVYAKSSMIARDALVAIEEAWELPDNIRFNKQHKNLFSRPLNVINIQIAFFIVLVLSWIAVLAGA